MQRFVSTRTGIQGASALRATPPRRTSVDDMRSDQTAQRAGATQGS